MSANDHKAERPDIDVCKPGTHVPYYEARLGNTYCRVCLHWLYSGRQSESANATMHKWPAIGRLAEHLLATPSDAVEADLRKALEPLLGLMQNLLSNYECGDDVDAMIAKELDLWR